MTKGEVLVSALLQAISACAGERGSIASHDWASVTFIYSLSMSMAIVKTDGLPREHKYLQGQMEGQTTEALSRVPTHQFVGDFT